MNLKFTQIMLAFLAISISSCATTYTNNHSYYKEHYLKFDYSKTPYKVQPKIEPVPSSSIKIFGFDSEEVYRNSLQKIFIEALKNNYVFLGVSSIGNDEVDLTFTKENIIKHAQSIKSSLVLVNFDYVKFEHYNGFDHTILFFGKLSKKPQLGIGYRNITNEEIIQFNQKTGVIIEFILENSPAFMSNLKKNDIIIEFDNNSVINANHFLDLTKSKDYSNNISKIKLLRNGREKTINILHSKTYSNNSDQNYFDTLKGFKVEVEQALMQRQNKYTPQKRKQNKLDQLIKAAATAQLEDIMSGKVTDIESFKASNIDSVMTGLSEVSGLDTSQLAEALNNSVRRKHGKSGSSFPSTALNSNSGGCSADLIGTWRAASSNVNKKDTMVLTNGQSNFKAYTMGGGALQTIGKFTYSTTNNSMTRKWISMKTGGTTSRPKPSTVPCSFDGTKLTVGNVSYTSRDNKQKQAARKKQPVAPKKHPTAVAQQSPPAQVAIAPQPQSSASAELDKILQEHSDISAELGAGSIKIKTFCAKTGKLMGKLYSIESKAYEQNQKAKFNLYMQSIKAQDDNCRNPEWRKDQEKQELYKVDLSPMSPINEHYNYERPEYKK